MLGPVEPVLQSLVFFEDEIVGPAAAVEEDQPVAVCGRIAQVLLRPEVGRANATRNDTETLPSRAKRCSSAVCDPGFGSELCGAASSMRISTWKTRGYWSELLFRLPMGGNWHPSSTAGPRMLAHRDCARRWHEARPGHPAT